MNYSLVSIVFLLLVAISQIISFAYFHHVFEEDSTCADIPPGSVVLALGFEHLGEHQGVISPGAANLVLAHALMNCADHYALVLTQKVVMDALQQEGLLMDGKLAGKVPVLPMHDHYPGKPVRTLQALQAALEKLNPLPESLVLMAHDKQIERAVLDLRSLYQGTVIVWEQKNMPYARPGALQPLRWAVREIGFARPVEGIQRMFVNHK